MDRRYSSSSTAKKPIANASIRFRNASSSDINNLNHRKSFPTASSSSDLASSRIQSPSDEQYGLTQAGLEEYSRSYYEQNMIYNHQKQSSYAQSEGYHSYVSSSDSTSTPFLDRLRQDSQLLQSRSINWSSSQEFQSQNLNGSTNSISSSSCNNIRECSESNSSTETLKWLGSMSDVSVASQATNTSTLSASSQLIVHSSKVHTPQRHNSESVLYMNDDNKINNEDFQQQQQRLSSRSDNRLFPISTYTEQQQQQQASLHASSSSLSDSNAKLSNAQQWQSVADRINELEKQQQILHDHNKQQQQQQQQQYTYLDPSKTNRIPNSTLKAFQKNAIQSYFERQQAQQQSIRLGKNGGSKSDDLSKLKSIVSGVDGKSSATSSADNLKTNGNALRPQSLNLSLAPSPSPSSANQPASSTPSSNNTSQRSSLSNWPTTNNNSNNNNLSPTTMIGSRSDAMMKNDVVKMNMKNSAMTSVVEQQKHLHVNRGSSKNQSIGNNNKLFTTFCEIKTETYSEQSMKENGIDGLTPPPLPKKNGILRRTSSASEYSSTRDKNLLHQNQHLSKDLLAPMILGKIISLDDWVPERPPKPKQSLSNDNNNLPLRVPSPDLPPPPPIEPVINHNQIIDDVLPLPPPEVLKESEMNSKISYPPSRRNSFAGQGSQPTKIKTNNIPLSPPAIPMRPKIVPTPIMTINPLLGTKNYQQLSATQDQTVHAQRVILQKQISETAVPYGHNKDLSSPSPPRLMQGRISDSRLSVRKRAHNSSTSKDCNGYNNSTTAAAPIQHLQTPPPLKPRMRNQDVESVIQATAAAQQNVFTPIAVAVNNNKVRSNSKASYLPRQHREKLLDPDHGSYKLTLHELNDTIKEYHQEDLTKCSNLPDVLPVNVKYHNSYRHNHRSPHNLTPIGLQPHFHSSDSHLASQTAPVLNGNALKSIFHFSSSSSPSTASTASVQSSASSSPLIPSSPFSNGSAKSPLGTPPSTLIHQNSPKYTSQSTIDLKMTQVIDPKLYTNEELIKAYHQQKEACRELNKTILSNSLQTLPECDNNKVAVVRKLNMVDCTLGGSDDENLIDTKKTAVIKTTSTESLEEKAMSEKSEKEIKKDEEAENSADALNTMQMSEIVLRVHPIMQETACQTDETTIVDEECHENYTTNAVNGHAVIDDCEKSKCNVFVPTRKKYPEEVDCENLSKDLASQLSPSDKLHSILVPKTIKSSSDYISDLFKINVTLRPTKKDVSTSTLEKTSMKSSMEMLTSNSTYFSTSEPKAKLMTRYSREMTLINSDSSDLTKKKEELVERLSNKLKVLETEQMMLAEESSVNDALGHEVAFKVAQKLKPADSTKFRSFVDDVGYITMLLLSLSGRLARIENALHSIGEKSADKKILESKRDRLLEQLDEAKSLKEDIDRRGMNLSKILEKSLTQDEYADYDYFINMKAKFIVDSREIADKIKLGEEQLNALKDTLVHSEC